MRRLFWGNPVLLRELQERVLSRRTMFMVTFWLVLLCGISALYYAAEATNTLGNQFDPFGGSVLRVAKIGQNMFDWLLFFMIGLVLFLVPGFTAASISGERERQTLLPMQVTLLRPIDIVVGKIAASVVFVVVLIALTAPILAFAYVIGGITIREVFISLAMMVFSAVAVACLTVACSAIVRRVPAAIVTSYVVVLALTVGSLASFGIAAAVDSSRGFDDANPPLTLLSINPVVALADVGDDPGNNDFFGGAETPMAALREMVRYARFGDNFQERGFAVAEAVVFIEGPDGIPLPAPPQPQFVNNNVLENQVRGDAWPIDRALPLWAQYLIAMTIISGLAIWVATRRVTTPAETER